VDLVNATSSESRPPTTNAAADPIDPQLPALARAVERTGRRVTALDQLVAQLAADVTALTRHLGADGATPDATAPGQVPPVRSWLLAEDPDQSTVDAVDLCEWLARVYLRYPRTDLPSCWLWHPHAVEELWWLRKAHADAYDSPGGSWLRVGDWHDRQLPGVTRRLNDAIGSCELALHLPGQRAAGAPRSVPFAEAAPFVAQTWTGSAGREPGPQPTAHQLDEADRIQRDRFTR
jgi:hypothetical protein